MPVNTCRTRARRISIESRHSPRLKRARGTGFFLSRNVSRRERPRQPSLCEKNGPLRRPFSTRFFLEFVGSFPKKGKAPTHETGCGRSCRPTRRPMTSSSAQTLTSRLLSGSRTGAALESVPATTATATTATATIATATTAATTTMRRHFRRMRASSFSARARRSSFRPAGGTSCSTWRLRSRSRARSHSLATSTASSPPKRRSVSSELRPDPKRARDLLYIYVYIAIARRRRHFPARAQKNLSRNIFNLVTKLLWDSYA